MLKIFYTKQGGVISIMLSIILVAVLAFSSTLIEIGRLKSAQAILHEADASAAISLLSDYDRDMFKNYGLLALSQEGGSEQMAERYKKYLVANLREDADGETKSAINNLLSGYSDATAEGIYSLNENSVLERQILESMKYRAPITMVADRIELTQLSDTLKSAFKMLEPLKTFASDALSVVEKISEVLTKIKAFGDAADDLSKKLDEYDKLYGTVCSAIQERDRLYAEVDEPRPEFTDPQPSPSPDPAEYDTEEEYEEEVEKFNESVEEWEKERDKVKEEQKKWDKDNEDYVQAVSTLETKAAEYKSAIGQAKTSITTFQQASDEFVSSLVGFSTQLGSAFLDKGIQNINTKQAANKSEKATEADKKVVQALEEEKSELELGKSYLEDMNNEEDKIKQGINQLGQIVMQINFSAELTYLDSHSAEARDGSNKLTVHGIDSKRTNVNLHDLIHNQLKLSMVSEFVKIIFNMVKNILETVDKMATVLSLTCGQGFWENKRYSITLEDDTFNNLSSIKVEQGKSIPLTMAGDKALGQQYISDSLDVAREIGYDTSQLTLGRDMNEQNAIQVVMEQLISSSGTIIQNISEIQNAGLDIPILGKLPVIGDWLNKIPKVIKAVQLFIPTLKACVTMITSGIMLMHLLDTNLFEMLRDGAFVSSYATEVFSNRTCYKTDKNIFGRKFEDIPGGTEWSGAKDMLSGVINGMVELGKEKFSSVLPPVEINFNPVNRRAFAGAETEYVLFGSKSEIENQQMASRAIFTIRVISNLITVATNEEAMEVVSGCSFLAPLVFILFDLGESAIDMIFLVNGVDVPLIKVTGKMAYLSTDGIGNMYDKFSEIAKDVVGKAQYGMVENLLGGKKEIKKSLTPEKKTPETGEGGKSQIDITDILGDLIAMRYQDYLWSLLCWLPNSMKVSRIGDLVEMQMSVEEGSTFRLSNAYTYVRTGVEGKYNLLVPVPGITGTFKPKSINYSGY